MSKLIVPKRLEKAANDLKNNMTILKGCSPEVKEVIAIARQERCLVSYTPDGDKDIIPLKGKDLAIAYCLPDSIEIVVEPDKPVVPAWVSKKYTVCEVRQSSNIEWVIEYPNTTHVVHCCLPVALCCDGWIFKGWLHKGCELLTAIPFGYVNDNGDIIINDTIWYEPSTAYASVWEKEGE